MGFWFLTRFFPIGLKYLTKYVTILSRYEKFHEKAEFIS